MTNIRGAQGNNFGELLTDSINIIAGQFSEGINSGVNGFKQFFGGSGIQGFAPNGQLQSSHNTHSTESTSEAFKDNIRRQMLASEAEMQAREVDFFGGPEDARAVSQVKQFGSL